MDQNKLQSRLLTVRKSLYQIERLMSAIETLSVERSPEVFEGVLTETTLLFESLTCYLRRILYDIYTVNKSEYLEKAAAAQSVRIAYGEGILEVALPCPLPKKKGKNSGQFLLDPLNAALEQFNRTLPIPKFRECAVCFVHVCRSDRASRKYFDYDNLQQKQILDVIALHAMVDDNSLLCDVYHTSQPRETDETKVLCYAEKSVPGMALRASRSLKNDVGFYPATGAVFSNICKAAKIPSGARLFSLFTIENFTVVFSTPGRKFNFGGDVMGLQKAPSPVRTH